MARAIEQLRQAMEACELGALTLPDQIDALMDAGKAVLKEAPTLTPPNEALTLEQLRQMDGRPVWIVEHPDWGHWELSADAEDYIADRDQDLYGLKHDDPAGQCGLHVLGWLAYAGFRGRRISAWRRAGIFTRGFRLSETSSGT